MGNQCNCTPPACADQASCNQFSTSHPMPSIRPCRHAHDEPPQGAQMSPSQCEAARAEPRARDAAHRLPAASAPEATTPASDTLPASLLELRTPSQLCCWANGCYPLPPVIPLSQQHALSKLSIRISIQLPGNAHKRLQELAAGVDGGAVQLRTIAVQQTTVLLDEE
eukprot:1148565-Pelagomonas_calceolata.AAC.3